MSLNDVLGNEPSWAPLEKPAASEDGEYTSEMLKPEVGEQVVGTYMGDSEFLSKFPNPKTGRKDKYNHLLKIKRLDGTDAVMWAKGNLWFQMQNVSEGTVIKLERLPDEETRDGYTVQTWLVFTASS